MAWGGEQGVIAVNSWYGYYDLNNKNAGIQSVHTLDELRETSRKFLVHPLIESTVEIGAG